MLIKGQETIADVFGVAPKTIVEWQEQGFPVAERGSPGVPSLYDSVECIRWYTLRAVRRVQTVTPDDRLKTAKAEEVEMRNAANRGELVPVALIEPKLNAVFAAAREALLADAWRIAPDLEGKPTGEIAAALEACFCEFLERLSHWSDYDDDTDEEEGPDGGADDEDD